MRSYRDEFMAEMREKCPDHVPPASAGCETPEYRRMTPPPAPVPAERASEYITISVAEYHFLTKTATLLEAVLSADPYNPKPVVDAARKAMQEMTGAGAAE